MVHVELATWNALPDGLSVDCDEVALIRPSVTGRAFQAGRPGAANWVVHVVLATFRSPSPAAVSGHRINGRSENGIRDSHVPVVSRHGWYSIGADISFFSS